MDGLSLFGTADFREDTPLEKVSPSPVQFDSDAEIKDIIPAVQPNLDQLGTNDPSTLSADPVPNPLISSRELTHGMDPQKTARVMDLSRKTGLPARVVEQHFDEMERREFLSDEKLDQIQNQSPKTAALLSDPNFFAVAQDDIDRIAALEGTISQYNPGFFERIAAKWEDSVQQLDDGILGFALGSLSSYVAMADLGEADGYKPIGLDKVLRELAREALVHVQAKHDAEVEKRDADILPAEGYLQQYLEDFVGASVPILAMMGISFLTKSPYAGAAFMGTQITGNDYLTRKEQGASDLAAFGSGLLDASWQAPLEALSLGKFFNIFKSVGGAQIVKNVVVSLGTEFTTEFLQKFPEDFTEDLALMDVRGQDIWEAAGTFLDGMDETARAGLYEGLLSLPWALLGGAWQAVREYGNLQATNQEQTILDALTQDLSQTNLAQIDPVLFQEAVRVLGQGTPIENIFIPAQAFDALYGQDLVGLSETLTNLGITMDAYQNAVTTGDELSIPLENYAATVAAVPDFAARIADHRKLSKDGHTRAEWGVVQQDMMETYRSTVRLADEEATARTAEEEETRAIYQEALALRRAAGRVQESAVSDAIQLTTFVTNLAKQSEGKYTATELWKAYMPQVTGPYEGSADQQTLQQDAAYAGVENQAEIEEAARLWAELGTESPYFKRWFGESRVVDDSGKPLVVYHGTPGEAIEAFDPARTGKGNDQLGSGFYFTSNEESAKGYARGDGSTTPSHLSIRNPITLSEDQDNLNDVPLTAKQAEAIMLLAPDIFDADESPLVNWIDNNGKKFTKAHVRQVAVNYVDQMHSLEGDIFGWDATAFRVAVNKVTGHDGIAKVFPNGERHYVAWFPAQIKSVNNRGTFDPGDARILNQSLSTRLPSAVAATEDPLNETLVLDYDLVKQDLVTLEKNMDAQANNPNVRKLKGRGAKDPVKRAEAYINHMVSNLLFLHDAMPEEMRSRAKLWYDGGRKMIERWAGVYGISEMQGAALIAVHSPQNGWFPNVSQAERVADIVFGMQDFRWDDAMTAESANVKDSSPELMAEAVGKTLGELLDRPEVAARWIRVYDQTHNSRAYRVLTPEGGAAGPVLTGKGEESTMMWKSFNTIAKGVSILTDGSAQNVYYQIGKEHKVRNFYNNLFDPNSEFGFATIDTHAVAAATLRSLSSADTEVLQAFGGAGASSSSISGMRGMYPIYWEAYRRAAQERGLLPREMQSITWEAVRGLFEQAKKTHLKKGAHEIWERYNRGEIEQEQAQQEIMAYAGGITAPSWSEVPFDDTPSRTYEGPAQKAVDEGVRFPIPQKPAKSLAFEVAPDPNDTELTALWNELPLESRTNITQSITKKVLFRVLREMGVQGRADFIFGGYLGDTNPSVSVTLNDETKLMDAAKALGFVLSQDSVVVAAETQIPGTEENGAVTILLPEGYGAQQIEALYDRLWTLEHEGEKLIGGHTTANGRMSILNFSGLDLEVFTGLINDHLNNEFSVEADHVFSTLIEKKDYGYASENQPTGNAPTRRPSAEGRMRDLRTEAAGLLREAIGADSRTLFQSAPLRGRGPQVLRVGDVGPVRASYGEQKAGGSSVLGIHYSREPRESLSGHFYGTGIKGSEARRLALSSDPRLSQRIHFYVDTGEGIRPEPGVGSNIHAVNLNNVYNVDEDQLGLVAAAYADKTADTNVSFNNLESSIIDAGFDGIFVPRAQATKGVVVLLGDHAAVPVDLVQSQTLEQQSPRGFVSAVETAITSMDFKTMPGKDLVNRIKKTGGIKAEELEDLGLIEWLEGLGSEKVTKDRVLDFVRDGGPKIEEVEKSRRGETTESDIEYNEVEDAWFVDGIRGPFRTEEDARAYAQQEPLILTRDDTKFGQYTLPGGKNYREVLLTLPDASNRESARKDAIEAELQAMESTPETMGRREELRAEYRDLSDAILARGSYQSSHWDEPNVLAHVRLNDRTGPNGEKILFIEEIQSDWHQAGRKEGYKTDKVPDQFKDPAFGSNFNVTYGSRKKDLAAAKEELPAARAKAEAAIRAMYEKAGVPDIESNARALAVLEDSTKWGGAAEVLLADDDTLRKDIEAYGLASGRVRLWESELSRIERDFNRGKMPDAPFKKSWNMLAFKLVLRMAAEQGYDSVSWTPGDVQAKRYDLSKQVESIGYQKRGDLFNVTVWDKSDRQIYSNQSATAGDLENVVGKEIAQKIADGVGRQDGPTTYLEDIDLKVGGEGMKGFYDKILPNEVNKYVKKWGVKVGVGQIDTGGGKPTEYSDFNEYTAKKDGAAQQAWSLPITGEMRQDILGGQALYQNQAEPQAAFTFKTASGKPLIELFRTADQSSFLHETGHLYLEMMRELALQPGSPAPIRALWAQTKAALGVDSDGQISREAHEEWARNLEAYFAQGASPSLGMRKVFAQYAQWMRSIYRQVRQIFEQSGTQFNADLTPIFDRLFATEAEIEEARSFYSSQKPFFSAADKVLPKEREKYEERRNRAKESMEDARLRQLTEAWIKANGGRARLRTEATEEVKALPVIAAIKGAEGGINIAALDAAVGEDLRKKLKAVGRYGALVKKEGTVDPSILAAQSGYASTLDMVNDMLAFPGEKAAISQRVEARVQEEKQRISRGMAGTELAADEAYHSDDQLAVLVAEFEILSQMSAQKTKRMEAKMVRDVAKQILAGEKVNFATQTQRFARLERKAAKQAKAAYEKGDMKKAQEFKRQEMLNHALFLESMALKKGIQKTASRIKRSVQKTKGISPEVKTLLRGMGIQYGLLPYKGERDPAKAFQAWNQDLQAKGGKIPTIEGWVQEMANLGISAPIDGFLNNSVATSYKDLTVQQFQALEEGVRIMRRVDKNLYTVVMPDGTVLAMEDVIELAKAAVAGRGGKTPDPLTYDPNAVVQAAKEFFAEHTKTGTIIQALDNWEPGGFFYQLLYRPIMDADSDLSARWALEAPKIKALFEPIRRTLRKTVVVLGKARPRAQLVALALNVGNAGNRERLMAGLGINEAQLDQLLAPLTTEEMDFVQSVWDYIGSFRDEAFAVEKRLTGREPAAIEAVPFTFKGKAYAGGYYPVSYDKKLRNQKGEARDTQAALDSLFGGLPSGTAMTAHGHLESRAAAGSGERLSQDLSLISEHLAQVLRDITHREKIINVAKLLKNQKFLAVITDVVGREEAKQLWPWLVSVAREGKENVPLNTVEKILLHFRPAMTFYIQAYKATTALLQMGGFFQIFEFVPKKYIGKAVWDLYGKGLMTMNMFSDGEIISHPLIKEIREKSPQMNERLLNADRDIRDATKEFSTSDSALVAYKKYGFKATVAMQFYAADVIAWQGAYTQAKAEGKTERDAVNFADYTVEQAMGSGYTRALAKIQRGGSIQRFLTMFYSFGSVLYNLAARRAGIAKKQLRSKEYGAAALGAAGFLMFQWVLPVLLESLIRGDLIDDDDDDETVAEKVLINLLTYPAQSVLIARELSGLAKGFKYRFSPATQPFESVGPWFKAIAKAIEEEDAALAIKPTAKLIGSTTGLIPAQFIKSGETLVDYMSGEDQELSFRDLLYGKRR